MGFNTRFRHHGLMDEGSEHKHGGLDNVAFMTYLAFDCAPFIVAVD